MLVTGVNVKWRIDEDRSQNCVAIVALGAIVCYFPRIAFLQGLRGLSIFAINRTRVISPVGPYLLFACKLPSVKLDFQVLCL